MDERERRQLRVAPPPVADAVVDVDCVAVESARLDALEAVSALEKAGAEPAELLRTVLDAVARVDMAYASGYVVEQLGQVRAAAAGEAALALDPPLPGAGAGLFRAYASLKGFYIDAAMHTADKDERARAQAAYQGIVARMKGLLLGVKDLLKEETEGLERAACDPDGLLRVRRTFVDMEVLD